MISERFCTFLLTHPSKPNPTQVGPDDLTVNANVYSRTTKDEELMPSAFLQKVHLSAMQQSYRPQSKAD